MNGDDLVISVASRILSAQVLRVGLSAIAAELDVHLSLDLALQLCAAQKLRSADAIFALERMVKSGGSKLGADIEALERMVKSGGSKLGADIEAEDRGVVRRGIFGEDVTDDEAQALGPLADADQIKAHSDGAGPSRSRRPLTAPGHPDQIKAPADGAGP